MINDLIGALAILALASTATTMILKERERQMSDNYLHEIEREEARDAAMFDTGPCYRHDYRSDRHGGGICVDCGDTIGRDEL